MANLKQLKGVANNLAASFTSPTNTLFLDYLESLETGYTNAFEIDLLNETIDPPALDSEETRRGY